MKRIYICQSRADATVDIRNVKSYLKQYNVIISEYQGGRNYFNNDKQNLLNNDILLIIPPKLNFNTAYVGKGQSSEYDLFLEKHTNTDIFVIVQQINDAIYCQKIENTDVIDINWKTEYRRLDLENKQYHLDIPMSLNLKSIELCLEEDLKSHNTKHVTETLFPIISDIKNY